MNFYNLERLIQAYLRQKPWLTRKEAERLARALRRLLDRLDRNWTNSENRFNRKRSCFNPEDFFGDVDREDS